MEFAVANISDIEWSRSSFDDVKILESQKKFIWGPVKTYLGQESQGGFEDLIQGKGGGMNFLF